MGHKHSRNSTTAVESITSKQNPFKLFEYQCPNCKSKRPIQYFYRNGVFLAQAPRVVCGNCNTSIMVEPFKTVDYSCVSCKKWQKVRLPAKPVPLNMYNISKVACNCGFRGEVSVGRLMDVACSTCWSHKRELRDVWTEDGDEIKAYCTCCQDWQRSFARTPKKKGAEQEMEYKCDGCEHMRPIGAEELLRNQGLACCDLCGWVGYPEFRERGQPQHQIGKAVSKASSKADGQGSASMRSTSCRSAASSGTQMANSSSVSGHRTHSGKSIAAIPSMPRPKRQNANAGTAGYPWASQADRSPQQNHGLSSVVPVAEDVEDL